MRARAAAVRGNATDAKSARPYLYPWILALLAAAGVGVAFYLLFTRLADSTIVCAGVGQCEYVNQSKYAKVFGLPVSAFGLGLYVALLGAALLWIRRPRSDLYLIGAWALALSGVIYSGYLTYIEIAVLEAICVWCVVSACILVLSLCVTTLALLCSEPA